MTVYRSRAAVPDVPPDTVLELGAGQWRYGDGPLRMRVDRVRHDLSRYYDDQVWLEGWRLDEAGVPVEQVQALVPVRVLPRCPDSAAPAPADGGAGA